MNTAPLYTDLEGMPEGGKAYWRRCTDNTRIRVALWRGGDKNETVLIFPGRTEYIEKYGPTVQEFLNRGYSVAVIDWRGQGLSDRHPKRPQMGWVQDFADYQQDVKQMLGAVGDAGFPRPTVLLSHSMGGAIGLRALLNQLDVKKTIFSAPMWGIYVEPRLRFVAGMVSKFSRTLGFGARYIPSAGPANYVEKQPFKGNVLTNDAATYKWMQDHLAQHPVLGLGGPSCNWYNRAVCECCDLRKHAPAPHETLVFLGTNEAIVDAEVIHELMASWSNGKLVEIDGAQHEILMEEPHVRKQFWDEVDSYLGDNAT